MNVSPAPAASAPIALSQRGSVRNRLRLLLLGLLVLVLGSGVLVFSLWRQQESTAAMNAEVREATELLTASESVRQSFFTLRRQIFLGLNQPQLGRSDIDRVLTQAEAQFAELSEHTSRIRATDPQTASRVLMSAREAMDLTRRATALGTPEASRLQALFSRLPELAKPAETTLQRFNRRVKSDLDAQLAAHQAAQRELARAASLVVLIIAVLALLGGLWLQRSVLRPLERLQGRLNQLKTGEPLTALAIGGPSEFERLNEALVQSSEHRQQVQQVAFFDRVTGLPNRTALEQAFESRLKASPEFALMFCDLDHFRTINEGYGHAFGDGILKRAGARLKELSEGGEVYRYSGDTFVVIANVRNPVLHGERLLRGMNELVELDGRRIPLNTSVGLARYPEDGDSLESLVNAADAAMFQAKKLGRNTLQVAHSKHADQARARLELAEMLRVAIAERQVRPYFQPILDLASGKVHCAEALARWQHPQRGFIAPDQFIAVAEATGLIDPLTDLLLREACSTAARWVMQGKISQLAFNLSAKQVRPGVVEIIQRVLTETGLPPERLEIEITEGAFIERPDLAERLLGQLRGLGVAVALDDFGTGYSSLSYLQRFPISKIKIDRSFVQKLGDQQHSNKIVAATIALADSMELNLVAEGVEELGQMLTLYEMGCRQQQGWLFAKAMPPDEFEQWAASAPIKLDAIVRSQSRVD